MFFLIPFSSGQQVLSNDLDPSRVLVAVDVWRKLFLSGVLPEESSRLLFKNMYQVGELPGNTLS